MNLIKYISVIALPLYENVIWNREEAFSDPVSS